jgi:mono/diheme cytochrome c family protein
MPTIKTLGATTASFLLLMAACSKGEPAAPSPAPAPVPAAETAKPVEAAPVATETAQDVFKNRCTPCHGATGLGDGPAAAALNPKPRNYTDAVWQKSVTDEQLKKTILYGGAAVGKSAVMPSQPDLESKPVVLDGLIKIIRDFGAPK